MDISIIIPLFNKAPYITRAIDSVVDQTIQASEIIVVDDGSTDEGKEIVAALSKNNLKIKLLFQKNEGVSSARNRGAQIAASKYVAFLDADDEWKPDFLANIQRLINNFPDCGAYATAYEIVEEKGIKYFPPLLGIPPAPWIGIIPNLFKMMQDGSPFYTSSVIMTKAVFQDLNGFPLGVRRGEDKILWIRLGLKYPIAYSPSRQVIYHREALNRACNIYEQEFADISLINDLLINQEVPLGLANDLKDYDAFIKIIKVRDLLKEGHKKIARGLLISIKKNRKYGKQRLWWYFLSFIPNSLLTIRQWVRQKR